MRREGFTRTIWDGAPRYLAFPREQLRENIMYGREGATVRKLTNNRGSESGKSGSLY